MGSPSFDISCSLDCSTRYHARRGIIHLLWSTWFACAFFVGVPTLCLIAALLLHWDLSRPGAFGLPGWAALLGGYLFMFVFMPLLHMFQLRSASRRNRTLLVV